MNGYSHKLLRTEIGTYSFRPSVNIFRFEQHYEAVETLKMLPYQVPSESTSFLKTNEYEYWYVAPVIASIAIKILDRKNNVLNRYEFDDIVNDEVITIVIKNWSEYIVNHILDLMWHRTFTSYKILHKDDLWRGLSLGRRGAKSFSGRIGSALQKGEIVKVGGKYRHDKWSRRSMTQLPITQLGIEAAKRRAASMKTKSVKNAK